MRPVVIHHGGCADGFGAAWVMRRHFGDPIIHAAGYGDPLPATVDGADVYVVDYCFEAPEMAALARRAERVLVLDHHATALDRVTDDYVRVDDYTLGEPRDRCTALLDMNRSGMGIAADVCEDDTWLTRFG